MKGNANEDPEHDTPGISSLPARKVVLTATASIPPVVAPSAVEADVPSLVDTQLATLQDVLDRADVVCEVVDARDVLGGRSTFIEDLVKESGGKLVLVVNKIGQSLILSGLELSLIAVERS